MATINLLPWRAERRERRKREFFTQLAVAAIAAVVLVLLWGFWVGLRIDNQNSRNQYLKGQIQQLDAKIAEISNLQKVKDQLLARKRIIEKLQSSRSQMVHLFDELVKAIPAGARLTVMKQQADKLTLDGVAQSNATVAEFMRNIEASPWMGPAQLIRTENVHTDANTPYEFELVVTLGTPKNEGEGGPASGASSAMPAVASSIAMPGAVATTSARPTPGSSTAGLPATVPTAGTTAVAAGSTAASHAAAPGSTANAPSEPATLPSASTSTEGGRP